MSDPVGFRVNHYRTGEEVRAGDRVAWAGRLGRVVFVLGGPGGSADWSNTEEWPGEECAGGFMLDVEGIGLVFEFECDEDLRFLGRMA